ncbi:hypothetical protein F3N42_15035 [Marinihelvus fidelis]|uniref:Uncharacterized protein n=1 Tax=Marinihelvus fidelis TaxID=2613842 RepID=A0A5N0T6A6_9GAMM|nr:hypothetical protein [Marinihelvus fidelis]KAA9129677.1 hypothetical protein F3N42_15035 [Marinihelvus fidelis]
MLTKLIRFEFVVLSVFLFSGVNASEIGEDERSAIRSAVAQNIERADLVFIGKVRDYRSFMMDVNVNYDPETPEVTFPEKRLFSSNQVEIIQVLKGEYADEFIDIYHRGGINGDVVKFESHSYFLFLETNYLLFASLSPLYEGKWFLTGRGQSAVEVLMVDGEPVVQVQSAIPSKADVDGEADAFNIPVEEFSQELKRLANELRE